MTVRNVAFERVEEGGDKCETEFEHRQDEGGGIRRVGQGGIQRDGREILQKVMVWRR